MKVVPLHSLVLVVGSRDEDRLAQLDLFPRHEVLTYAGVCRDLVGVDDRYGMADAVRQEIQRRVTLKLKLGERVVVDAQGMDRHARQNLANMARNVGVAAFYLVSGPADPAVMRGEGVAEVIDVRNDPARPVLPQPNIRERFRGVTAIGDVHGMHNSLLNALAWARSRNQFVMFMGDVIDYGPATLDVADEVYRVVMRGEGAFVLGNHERKIMRWIDGNRVHLSDGNRTTTRALAAIGDSAKAKWVGRFRGLYQTGALIRRVEDVSFVHAALHPSIWEGEAMSRVIENMAFFGEIDEAASQPDRPVRSYRWVESIPAGQTVVVGHDRRSANPFVHTNTIGGRAVFLDTGSGKGGVLSSADFRFTDSGLRLENFNIH